MNIQLKPARNSAAGQYLGYAIQPVRALVHLLTAPETSQVSMEYIDDVGVHYADNHYLLEQDKSAHSHNPLSNGAKDLWKTIGDWIDYVTDNSLGFSDGEFVLYVTPNKVGEFATDLSNINDKHGSASFCNKVQKYFDEQSPRGHAREGMKKFLALAPNDMEHFVSNITIISEDNPLNELKKHLRITDSGKLIDEICKSALGFVTASYDRKLMEGKDAIIPTGQFVKQLASFLQKFNVEQIFPSMQPRPHIEEVSKIRAERPVFIQQLELIELDEKLKDRAITDFLQTSGEKAIWAEKGIINEETLQIWDDKLERQYSLIKTEVAATQSDLSAKQQGRSTYARCAGHQTKLEGKEVPDHFVNGSYNALSNDKVVGWHPDYVALLSEKP